MLQFVVLCLFLDAVSTASYGQSTLDSVSSLTRSRRQTAREDQHHCAAVASREHCSTSYAQNLINAISECGDNATSGITSIFESHCRQNDQGLFCGEALDYVTGNCTAATCRAECFNSLRQAGCCINEESFSFYRILTTCNISMPSPCPQSNLEIPEIVRNSSCTTAKFKEITLSVSCDNIKPVIAALSEQDMCKAPKEIQQDICSSRNGQYCLVELGLAKSNTTPTEIQAIRNVDRDCPSLSNCTIQCNSSLNFVKDSIGCCFPSLNATFSLLSYANSSQLWKACEIPVPQRCDNTSVIHGGALINDSSFACLCLILASLAIEFLQGM